MPTSPVTTTSASSVCLKCGTVMKSGKSSCCGRGGSWFGRCTSARDANLTHTWYDGVRVCTAQRSQQVIQQRLQASLRRSDVSSDDDNMGTNSETVIADARMSISTLDNNPKRLSGSVVTTVFSRTPIMISARTSLVHNTGATNAKAITTTNTNTIIATISASTSASANTVAPEQNIPSYKAKFSLLTYPEILPPLNETITNSVLHHASADVSMTSLSHSPDSASVIMGEYQTLVGLPTHILILLISASWYTFK